MATAAERQRQRRERLRGVGDTEVTVRVPAASRGRLYALAQGLRDGLPISPRLIHALAVLRGRKNALGRLGVVRAGIFGSVARGEDTPDSDIDVLLVLNPDSTRDLFDLVAIRRCVFEAFGQAFPDINVDVSVYQNLKVDVRRHVDAEAVYAY